MRVISQDGTNDFPYDSSSVSIYEGCINGRIYVRMQLCGGCDDSVDVADYSTKEKAEKAMEMLRDTYQYGKRVAVPKLDESGIDKEDDITLYNTRLINDFFKGGTYVPTKVFQFPKDEDVEV